MAFSISVYHKIDREFLDHPPDPLSAEFEGWETEALQRCLFWANIGSGGNVSIFWSEVAKDLKLKHISRLYDDGLVMQDDGLEELKAELRVLRIHWITTVNPEEMIHERIAGYGIELSLSFLHYLLDHANAVEAAVTVAQRCDGYVIMG